MSRTRSPRRQLLEWLAEAVAMVAGASIIVANAWSSDPGTTYAGILLYWLGKMFRIARRVHNAAP